MSVCISMRCRQMLTSTSKVLVDQKGGNSLLYLPLDKLMQQSVPARTAVRPKRLSQPANRPTPVPATHGALA